MQNLVTFLTSYRARGAMHRGAQTPSTVTQHQEPCHSFIAKQGLTRTLKLCFVLFVMVLTPACSRRYDDVPVYSAFGLQDYDNHSVGRFKTSYLAEQIDNYYRGANPGPIGVTTFVNLDDLYATSSFGRMVGEQMVSELAMRGYDVIELRQSDAIQFVANRGEFALSRNLATLRRERQLGAIVVGTYVASPERVYLNARLIDPTNSLVLSAGSVEMEKTTELAKMLKGSNSFPTLERIPVRQLGLSTYPVWPPHGLGVDPLEAALETRREDFDYRDSQAQAARPTSVQPRFAEPPPPPPAAAPPQSVRGKLAAAVAAAKAKEGK